MSAPPRTCPKCFGTGPFYASPRERQCRPCTSARVTASERRHADAKRVRRQAAKAGIRARTAGARGIVSAAEWRACLDAHAGCCAYCERHESEAGPLALDHVYPLARGGPNDASNIVPACERCNERKGALPPMTFALCLDLPFLAHRRPQCHTKTPMLYTAAPQVTERPLSPTSSRADAPPSCRPAPPTSA